MDEVSRGKTFISLDLKCHEGQQALQALVREADVFVESFRPGIADRLGAGWETLTALNPALVYCSLTGYGQDGPMAHEAGHDINYLSVTGVLGSMGPRDAPPSLPLNLVADFAGGSLVAAMTIASALYERERSGRGQYLDVAMIDGVHSMMAMYFTMWKTSAMPERGMSIMDGSCPFYRCYECADGQWVAVGALEPQFFTALWTGLDLGEVPPQYPRSAWPRIEQALTERFLSKPRDEWVAGLAGTDACVTAVLSPDEVATHPQIVHRHGVPAQSTDVPPVAKFSRTPAQARDLDRTDETERVLRGLGMSDDEIRRAHDQSPPGGLAGWPQM